MPDLVRDLIRLNLIDDNQGLESLALPTGIHDFFKYYFTRFISNLTHAFSPFAASELDQWHAKHKLNVAAVQGYLTKNPNRLVPIPQGMIYPYSKSLQWMISLLKGVSYTTLKADVEAFAKHLKSGNVSRLDDFDIDQAFFDVTKNHLLSLYAEPGLSHRPVRDVLVSAKEVFATDADLRRLTRDIYPDIIAVNKIIPTLESDFRSKLWSIPDTLTIKAHCMKLGYRLTLFALIVDHIQKLEHGFVESLTSITAA